MLECCEQEDAHPVQHGEEARESARVRTEKSAGNRNPRWLMQSRPPLRLRDLLFRIEGPPATSTSVPVLRVPCGGAVYPLSCAFKALLDPSSPFSSVSGPPADAPGLNCSDGAPSACPSIGTHVVPLARLESDSWPTAL